MNPRLTADLEALAIGVVGGAITYYVTKAIDRYVVRRTVRKRKQALEQATTQLGLIEKLTSSDRATLLFGFRVVCVLVAFIAIAEFATRVLTMLRGGTPEFAIGSLVWGIVAILSFYFAVFFRDLDQPEKTLETLRTKIETLKDSSADDGAA